MPKKVTIKAKKKGQKSISFEKGGLHRTTHTPMGQKIPESKLSAAMRGDYGPKGKKEVMLMHNVLYK